MSGLLRFLFIVISVLWLLKVLVRMLLPFLFQQVVNKARQQSNSSQQPYRRPEGSIRVDYIPPHAKEPTSGDKAGDFIDYEEIK